MNKKIHGRENDSVAVVDEVPKSEVALREEAIQAFWEKEDIFNKSLIAPASGEAKGDFVFYDGPPFATGLPHYGHILAGTIKDAIPRFWTMNGYRVRRKWGWDCHGLPLENLIEKKLGLATKRDIEEYGIKNFNEAARDAVMEYADDWRRIIPRMGRFADMADDYKTMDSTYTESVWWVFKSLHEKGLVYEGFKSMHLCPRCGTTLSNFEVNQGYKDIKDIAVTVKMPLLDEAGKPTDTSLLIWTTTPWTLPGNMAVAVHNDIDYVRVKVIEGDSESLVILAKERLAQLGDLQYEVVEEMKGADLVGKKYLPPFDYLQKQNVGGAEKAWTIYHADYVELGEEGTGAVHIAPAYGDDDMKLAQAHNVPIIHHVDEAGHFMDFVGPFAGQLVKPKDDDSAGVDHKDADIEILKALQATGKVLKKENITHSYPHCWRCETPLINYATTSWFVEVTKFKDDLVATNKKVSWVPEHVGTNRFGKWLDGARDWAVSRQRYWGAPLPIWRNPETKEFKVFGSLTELQEFVPKSGNTYLTMRHGESESNVKHVISCNKENADGLTETGKEQVQASLGKLSEKIDLIIHSGFERTKTTAEIVAAAHREAEVLEDDRIRELDLNDNFEGGRWDEYNGQFETWQQRYTKKLDGSENRRDVQVRMGAFIKDLDKTYAGKRILIVSHAGPLFALECFTKGLTAEQAEAYFAEEEVYHRNAEVRTLSYVPLPHNDNYELDYHRPYIDEIELFEGEVKLERVPDVFDCWFESGSMPYGQHHYPFENKDIFEKEYFPAKFIAEGLDQTRGWFYSMIVLGVALFGRSPFENVVVNGTVLAENGVKMSKSLQNYPDPMEVAHTSGADAMRFYLLSSPAVKGEDLNFSEKEVLELQRKNIGRLHNVLAMYEMFTPRVLPTADAEGAREGTQSSGVSEHVLDRWIIARLNQLVSETSLGYKSYELDKATRPVTDFIDDLSVWYLRRSRDRLKGDNAEDKKLALATLRHTLQTLALIMAPAMPFYAEYLWLAVREESDAESVHLAKWPEGGEVETGLLNSMSETREVVTAALEARTKAGIKVRQPVASVSGPLLPDELQEVVLDELNAKEYKILTTNPEDVIEVKIDTQLTPELISEGVVRELMRAVQGKRKSASLEPHDEISLTINTDKRGQAAIQSHQEMLTKTVGATKVDFAENEGEVVKSGEYQFTFSIKKL